MIQKDEAMSTREKRNGQMAKYFDLCKIRNINLYDNLPGEIKVSLYVYMSPRDQLRRQLEDPGVFSQFLVSGQPNTLYDGLGTTKIPGTLNTGHFYGHSLALCLLF